MKNNEIHEKIQSDFLKNVSDILLQARKNAKSSLAFSIKSGLLSIVLRMD